MARIAPIIRQNIGSLSKKELEKLVLKAAKDQSFHDFLLVNYFDQDFGEQDLFEKTRADLQYLFVKNYKGLSVELKLAHMLTACSKRINEFDKVAKDKSLVMDLMMEVLKIPFSTPDASFSTCFTKYNYRVYLLVKKILTLLNTKLHEDYYIEYAPLINKYLATLHATSDHLDYIYSLPESV